MAAAVRPKDHLSDLGRHIRILEEKIAKLRASLTHWQKWYLEYSSLWEEVSSLPPGPQPRTELARIRRDFDSEVLTKKEIDEIFGENNLKERDQILSLLSRRVDYVEQNLASLQKLLETEENKLAAANVVAFPDAGVDEETGLPITDIVEQLDDDDNVIDFKLQRGGDLEPRILEALKKVGVDDLASAPPSIGASAEQTGAGDASPGTAVPREPQAKQAPPPRKPHKEVLVPDESDEEKAAPPRKSVSFVEDTKAGHDVEEEPRPSRAAQELAQIMHTAKEQEAMDLSTAVIPDDEAAEDGELRRQMLQYGMSEIGPVVAELELEEGDGDDDSPYDDSDSDSDESESEDELGRSKMSVITEDYIQRMKELEKRLGVQSAFTAAPHQPKTQVPEEGIGRISVQRRADSRADSAAAPTGKGKKSVKFASSIPEDQTKAPDEPKVNPLGDILERTGGAPSSRADADATPSTKRPSRFKKERGASAEAPSAPGGLPRGPHQVPARFSQAEQAEPLPTMPTGPEGQTIADTVMEREVSSTPRDPDAFDSQLLHQAASVEYNRMRNRMIQRQGGFTKESESAITPVEDEEDEPRVRVSRFKAARLSRNP